MLKNVILVVALALLAGVALSESSRPVAAEGNPGYALAGGADVGGLWVQRDSKSPFAAVYSQDIGGRDVAVVGLSRNQKGDGHEFAIVANRGEVYFQIRDEKGKFHFVPVQALLKLADKDAPVHAEVAGAR